ncbi:ATP-binding protein [Vibrio gazogenes]|uniref:histidine kinase n=1 Tax=Vibrio gazogenes DSM 21264 = NBRC 103151 TaxID=1123492 RepID=A0A1M5EYK9_VIBGA|nr:ATP-binding protein [Vibrio gazogenes]USP14769.1 ATP-binding protein [Vibrio gazogenes]SHF84288.1 PAS fold-containing protein [Vibrio gazogenes DSM 21264] [Vibrio gazogenes DSM 21264 = NBRC 103151]SJN55141.1 Sporulation kinase E [Vibrio gazogenes]
MHPLEQLLKKNELWLMRRIRDYAVERDYSRYTSTLEEAWRIAIVGLTDSIISALTISEDPWELSPEDTYISDPIAAFGVLEAQRHRSRGVTLEMFLGLMKYYRQTYLDLLRKSYPIGQASKEEPLNEVNNDREKYSHFIERVFDRIEIAFCAEWGRSDTMNRAIEELQETNRRITNEKNKFLTIFESMPTAVFLLDDKRRIVHMNFSAAQMIDPTAKSGGHYYSHPDDRIPFPWLEDELSRFYETGDEKEYEYLIELPDKDECQVLARFHPMEDISLKYTGKVVILQDITERKKAEKELKQTQSYIIHQEKMASIGQLAAGVAHEINNPMGFIISNLSSLREYIERLTEFITVEDQAIALADIPNDFQLAEIRKKLKIDYISEDVKELIVESLDGAERVKHIVQELKTFSRVDQADYTLIDLNETIKTTMNIAWNEIKYVATLEHEFGNIPKINCYPQQLNQVFLNLLVNAAQAIKDQGTITVRTWCDEKNINVSITDTGSGISPKDLARIFEPFYTTKDVGKGTGLGLSISYSIIQNHGGEIKVESEIGKGSTFTVILPIHK